MWIADIAQPGYLQFYNWREAMELLQKVQKKALSTQVGGVHQTASNEHSSPAQKPQQSYTNLPSEQTNRTSASSVPASTPTSSSSNCRVARNDFESVLLDSQVGCWQTVPANARNKN
nr:hypothetical protein [Iningainema tapete]